MIDTSTSFRVIEATAGAQCIGICTITERRDPSNSDGLAAITGEPIKYWGNGAKDVPAQLGANSVTAGTRLKATTAGKLIPTASDSEEYVAIAKQAGNTDDLIAVDVTLGQRGA
jgi:hypothetical protein